MNVSIMYGMTMLLCPRLIYYYTCSSLNKVKVLLQSIVEISVLAIIIII